MGYTVDMEIIKCQSITFSHIRVI